MKVPSRNNISPIQYFCFLRQGCMPYIHNLCHCKGIFDNSTVKLPHTYFYLSCNFYEICTVYREFNLNAFLFGNFSDFHNIFYS